LPASSEAGKFGPHRANCKLFLATCKKLNIQACFVVKGKGGGVTEGLQNFSFKKEGLLKEKRGK
jgi:hypothetical protein